jgi:hypothetical protein
MSSSHEKDELLEEFKRKLADLIINPSEPSDSNRIPENSKAVEEHKEFIAYLMNLLKVSPVVFEPERIVVEILKYIKDKDSNQRLLYSEITIDLYRATDSEKDNIEVNINHLITYARDKQPSKDLNENEILELNEIILKFYDHVSLANFQVQQIQEAVDESKRNVNNAFE